MTLRTRRKLCELLEITSSKRIKAADYKAEGIPFFRGKEVIEMAKGSEISNELFISREQFAEIDKKFGSPKQGDILLSSVGTLGVALRVEELSPFYFKDGNLTWFRNFSNEVDSAYVYHWLRSRETQQKLREISIGTTQQALTIVGLKNLEIELPALKTQEKIVSIIQGLEHSITNFRLQNITLESIAQTLFKSWFVNFDPVHAKAAGQEPEGLSAEIAALFPSEFEESELGLIPKGWGIHTLGNTCNFIKGRSYKSSELSDSNVALVTLKSFNRGGGFRTDGFKSYVGLYKHEQIVHEGDCIVALTDVTQNADVIGRPAKVFSSPNHDTLVASLDVGILRPKNSTISVDFLSCLLKQQRYVDHILAYTSGTTVLHLAKDGVPSYRFPLPNQTMLTDKFKNLVEPIFRLIEDNQKTAYVLSQIRDELLPRLISGKIQIEEAEEALADVVPSTEKQVA